MPLKVPQKTATHLPPDAWLNSAEDLGVEERRFTERRFSELLHRVDRWEE
jgi:hypothetical protein